MSNSASLENVLWMWTSSIIDGIGGWGINKFENHCPKINDQLNKVWHLFSGMLCSLYVQIQNMSKAYCWVIKASCRKRHKILYNLYIQILPHRIILHISADTYISKYEIKSLKRYTKLTKVRTSEMGVMVPRENFSFIHNVLFFIMTIYSCITCVV